MGRRPTAAQGVRTINGQINLPELDPKHVKDLLDADKAVLIDIREPVEYAREHIVGARLVPLDALGRTEFAKDVGKTMVFLCRTGNRTAVNAATLRATGLKEIYCLKGGLDAWKGAGLPVRLDRKVPIDLMRQVQIAAGSLVLLGVVLAVLVSPWFMALSAFVGAGLVFAGASGFCGMARMLGLVPWNRRAAQRAAAHRPDAAKPAVAWKPRSAGRGPS